MAVTDIRWTWRQLPDGTWVKGYSFNPWWGCMKVSEECSHCYALDVAHHYYPQEKLWGPEATTSRRFFGASHWAEPLAWNRAAKRDGHRRSVFCASMADIFEHNAAIFDEREKLWDLIGKTPWLNWLLLTKRPENILAMSPWESVWPDNVWIGTSVGLQKRAEERIPHLLNVPAVVRFLSCEPLLGRVDLSAWIGQLQWVIAGGESGPHFRPLNLDDVRALRDQCQQASVPFYFKQVGGRTHDKGGRVLDGREWIDMPEEVMSSLPISLVGGGQL